MKLNSKILFIALLASVSSRATDYIVKFKSGYALSMKSILAAKSNSDMKVLDSHESGRLFKVRIDNKDKGAQLNAVKALMLRQEVEYVVKDFKLHRFEAPISAEALKEQWHLAKVRASDAWAKAGNKGSRKVLVALIDTGTDYNHPSLAGNTVAGFDFHDNDSDPMDLTGAQNPGHGTHCAGIIGANGQVEGGTSGMVQEVGIMPLRFLGADGSGDLMAGIKAIDYAIEKGAKVISASWGATIGRKDAQPLVDAVKRADDAGVIFVAAAANDGHSNDTTEVYPANAGFPNTITVAASSSTDTKPSWSNYGKKNVHVAAPGLDIMSTLPAGKYSNLSGTSMATPLVSGLVAFLLAQDATLTGASTRALLQATGAKVSIETACNCRVDAFGAVSALLDHTPWLVPQAVTLKANETQGFKMINAQGTQSFASADAAVATIAADGTLKAVGKGETTVSATDAAGHVAKSLTIRIVDGSEEPPPATGECPIQDPQMCEILCSIDPTAAWCKQP
jgi:thermitase